MVWNAAAWNGSLNMSPLLQAVQGYRKGLDENYDFQTNQQLGADIAAGRLKEGMQTAAGRGMDPSVLLTLGNKAREDEQRQRQAEALKAAEANPDLGRVLTPEVRASLAALSPDQRAAKIAEYADPMKRAQLDIQRQQAQRQAADQYGKQGTVVQDKDGTFYSVQFGSNGQKIVQPLQFNGSGLAPSKGVGIAGDAMYDKATGADVRSVGSNIAGAAAAKEIGEAQGKATVDAPRINDNASQMLDTIKKAREHPGREMGTGPVAGRLPALGGDQAGFVALMNQIQGKTFLEAFNSLRGGGQITEAEGKKATDALARLDRVQNKRDFDLALKDLEAVVKAGQARAQNGQRPTASQAAPQQAGPKPGDVVSHPSGKFRFKGGKLSDPNSWEKIQ